MGEDGGVLLKIILIFFAIGIGIPLAQAIFEKIFLNPKAMDIVFIIVAILGVLFWIVVLFTDMLLLQIILFPFGMLVFAALMGQTFSKR